MRNIFVIFLLIVLMIFLSSCTRNFKEISINNEKQMIKVKVEIADDIQEREKGLMFREKLDENSGMLFVFDDENYQTFWMKNTLIPLDIIFIGKNYTIVDIKQAVPCDADPCSLYKSSFRAKYVLEVNSLFSAKNDVVIGNIVNLSGIY